jgi:diguanylate cyclase (GGDEF)-like protein
MPCAVALIDLDWFKRINDRFGHPAGDEVLRAFAITMFANIRSIDKFGRYGGEEFLLILPETSDGAALRTVDRLRLIVADLDWSAISNDLHVTMSAGIATLRPATPQTPFSHAPTSFSIKPRIWGETGLPRPNLNFRQPRTRLTFPAFRDRKS